MAVGKVGGSAPVSSSQAQTASTAEFDEKSAKILEALKSKSGASTHVSRQFAAELAKLTPEQKALEGKDLDSCLNKCATKANLHVMQSDFFDNQLKKSMDDLLASMKDW